MENSVQLSGGPTPFEGRVEVCLGGSWGSVCRSGWSSFDAIVTCRQLGFSFRGIYVYNVIHVVMLINNSDNLAVITIIIIIIIIVIIIIIITIMIIN